MNTHLLFDSKTFFLALMVLCLLPTAAMSGTEPDPTSQSAWSDGNLSGKGNFQSYCMPCHGPEGRGDGVLAESMGVKPRNLSDVQFMAAKSDDHLFKVIKHGGVSVGLTENMTPFDGQLSDQEINNVVQYVRKEICKCSHKAP